MEKYIERSIVKKLMAVLKIGKSVLLFGSRQTGKTTLMRHIKSDLMISLADVRVRIRYEKNPGLLADEIEAFAEEKKNRPLVIIDEIQKIPILTDVVQDLIDREIAQFILTGSSARKLKKSGNVNFLPGRVICMYMDPFTISEIPEDKHSISEFLIYGSLPEIVLTKSDIQKEELLNSYVMTYLEEEIRAEALVRSLGSFARFLELAAAQSGNIINLHKLSQEIGVSQTTISSYYEILEDCLVIERIEALSKSTSRKRLMKSPKCLFFDLGVRRVAAREGTKLPRDFMGHLFEQFVGLELIRYARNSANRIKINYWRDPDGPEVDWIINRGDEYIPIEVKWTDTLIINDAKYLKVFLNEYKEAKAGFVICQTPAKIKLADNIYAISWKDLGSLMF